MLARIITAYLSQAQIREMERSLDCGSPRTSSASWPRSNTSRAVSILVNTPASRADNLAMRMKEDSGAGDRYQSQMVFRLVQSRICGA